MTVRYSNAPDGTVTSTHGQCGATLNVVDVEATCWDSNPPSGQVSEVIEIGLAVVDTTAGVRVSRHRILVCPQRSLVSAFHSVHSIRT
jgi:inhibitor of KinA sporulation pathway (predicted exonuclease)